MGLADFLIPDAIITDLHATAKRAAIREIVRKVQDAGYLTGVDTGTLTSTFLEREALGSTGIGGGCACPHGGHEAVDRVFGTIALSRPGVAFDSCDGELVHVIFLLFHPPGQFHGQPMRPGGIYEAFQAIAGIVRDGRAVDHLRWCHAREEVLDLIAESELPGPGSMSGAGGLSLAPAGE